VRIHQASFGPTRQSAMQDSPESTSQDHLMPLFVFKPMQSIAIRDSARTAQNQKKHTQKEQATNRKAKGSGFEVIQEYHATWILNFQSFVARVGLCMSIRFFVSACPCVPVYCVSHTKAAGTQHVEAKSRGAEWQSCRKNESRGLHKCF